MRPSTVNGCDKMGDFVYINLMQKSQVCEIEEMIKEDSSN